MPWLLLFLAGLCEIGWATALKYSHGFTRPAPTAVVILGGLLSVYLLGLAARQIPIGTAYAVWTGIGAVGTAIVGITMFAESRHWLRLVSILLVVVGIVGLRLFTPR